MEIWIKTKRSVYKRKHKPHVYLQNLPAYENYQEELLALNPNT